MKNEKQIGNLTRIDIVLLLVLVMCSMLAILLPLSANPEYFTIVVLPDTQNYSHYYPNIFRAQTQWIVDNKDTENIIFVAHVGDIVDFNHPSKWVDARAIMGILRESNIPYSIIPGNHDMNYASCNYSTFNAYFPYTDFTGYPWYGGHFPENGNENNYALFSVGLEDFLILSLGAPPLASVYEWANEVLTTHPSRKAIIVTHGYIDPWGTKTTANDVNGLGLWENVIRKHENIIAVLCGHWTGEKYTVDTGDNGNIIHNLLACYEGRHNGGNGFLRLLRFYPNLDKVEVLTYSPYLNEWETDSDSQFEFYLPMK